MKVYFKYWELNIGEVVKESTLGSLLIVVLKEVWPLKGENTTGQPELGIYQKCRYVHMVNMLRKNQVLEVSELPKQV